MDAQDKQIKDLRPEILLALQDLARLSLRSIQNGADAPSVIASDLLERLQQVCQATHGAIFLAVEHAEEYPGSTSSNGARYRPLALHGIEEKDVDVLLTPFSEEMLSSDPRDERNALDANASFPAGNTQSSDPRDERNALDANASFPAGNTDLTSRPTLHPSWLVWRLPLALPFSHMHNDGMEAEKRGQEDDPPHMPQVFFLFGWESQDEVQRTIVLERGRLLLPTLADAVGSVLAQTLAYEYIQELETRADHKALQGMELLKAELLASVSHELRSPLTSIKGYAVTLLRHERRISREERHEFLLAINEASDRLAGVIDALLEMSELETGSIEIERAPVDLTYLVREALAVAAQKLAETDETPSLVAAIPAKKRPTFAIRIEPPRDATVDQQVIIQADRNRLREVLDHLLANAINHMPEGGTIRLFVRLIRSTENMKELLAFSQDGGVKLALMKQRYQQMAVIAVQDSGKGIPEHALERIFDPFYRVDTRLTREVNGLGLGLAVCRRIVELHNGVIWAESRLGKGSTFFVCLPLL